MAMERGLPVPDDGATRIDSLLAEADSVGTNPGAASGTGVQWVRLTALALGVTALFAGLGVLPGFYYQSDPEVSGIWPVGLIPILIGAGLLIFVRLSRSMVDSMNGGRESR